MKKVRVFAPVTILIFILLTAWTFAFFRVNAKYHQLKPEIYSKDDTVLYSGFEINVDSVEWVDKEKLGEMGIFEADSYAEKCDSKGLFVKINAKNIGNEPSFFPYYDFYCAGEGWSNGAGLEWMTCIDSNEPMMNTVSPGETIELTLTYALFDIQFRKSIWKNVENMNYYLVYSLYPIKKIIVL